MKHYTSTYTVLGDGCETEISTYEGTVRITFISNEIRVPYHLDPDEAEGIAQAIMRALEDLR